MSEINDFERFHPRAVKLMRKHKPFVVVACDEPYYVQVYSLIREHEISIGRWSTEDERVYRDAQQRNEADKGGAQVFNGEVLCKQCNTPRKVVESNEEKCPKCGDAPHFILAQIWE